jgi:hypothetical protein
LEILFDTSLDISSGMLDLETASASFSGEE